jgi:hypothetical protein
MIVRDQTGSLLVEVMIGGSLLAGVGLAGATLYKNHLKNQDYLDKIRQLDVFHASLTRLLQNTSHCNATFNPWRENASVPGQAPNDLKHIRLCSSNCSDDSRAASVGTTAADIFITKASARLNDEKQWIAYGLSPTSPRQRFWQVRDMGFGAVGKATKTGKYTLDIIYELYPGRQNTRTVQKSIDLFFKFAPGPLFISCGNQKESSVRSVLQEMCDALTKVPGSAGKILAKWNEKDQKCDIQDSMTCPANWTFAGFDTNGQVSCISLTKNVDASEFFDPTPQNCSGNKTPSLTVGPDKKVMIECN